MAVGKVLATAAEAGMWRPEHNKLRKDRGMNKSLARHQEITPAPASATRRKKARGTMKPIPTIDAHHHIWRLKDLTWLSGSQVPRIFGPYEAIRRDYPIDEFRADTDGCEIVKSVYVQTNWPAGQSLDEAQWVQSVSDATGWPHANVAHADLADPDGGTLI